MGCRSRDPDYERTCKISEFHSKMRPAVRLAFYLSIEWRTLLRGAFDWISNDV